MLTLIRIQGLNERFFFYNTFFLAVKISTKLMFHLFLAIFFFIVMIIAVYFHYNNNIKAFAKRLIIILTRKKYVKGKMFVLLIAVGGRCF